MIQDLTIVEASNRGLIEFESYLRLRQENARYKIGIALGVVTALTCIAIVIINALGMSGHLSTIHLASSNFAVAAITLPLGLSLAKIHSENFQIPTGTLLITISVAFLFFSFFAANVVALRGVISTHTLGAITICSPMLIFWLSGAGGMIASHSALSEKMKRNQASIVAKIDLMERLYYRILLNPTRTLIAQATFILTFANENDPFYVGQLDVWRRLSGGFRAHHGERMYALLLNELQFIFPNLQAERFARLDVNPLPNGQM